MINLYCKVGNKDNHCCFHSINTGFPIEGCYCSFCNCIFQFGFFAHDSTDYCFTIFPL